MNGQRGRMEAPAELTAAAVSMRLEARGRATNPSDLIVPPTPTLVRREHRQIGLRRVLGAHLDRLLNLPLLVAAPRQPFQTFPRASYAEYDKNNVIIHCPIRGAHPKNSMECSNFYIFPYKRFLVISLAVILTVSYRVGPSSVDVKVSANPNGNIRGIQPMGA